MSVIPLTVFLSLLLAGVFVALFARDQLRRRFASAERDSLLPLADETPHAVHARTEEAAAPDHAHEDHDHDHHDHDDHDHSHGHGHDHAGAGCGCRDGSRPPCVGCLRQLQSTRRPAA